MKTQDLLWRALPFVTLALLLATLGILATKTPETSWLNGAWPVIGTLGGAYLASRGEERRQRLSVRRTRQRLDHDARMVLQTGLRDAIHRSFDVYETHGGDVARGLRTSVEAYRGSVMRIASFASGGLREAAVALAGFLATAASTSVAGNSSFCTIDRAGLYKLQQELTQAA